MTQTSQVTPVRTLPSTTPTQPKSTGTPLPQTSTPTVTPSFTPTATLTACMRSGGNVGVYEFTTTLLPDPLVYRIYLPPCYQQDAERSYPVLYLIHGQTYSDTQWDRLGVPEVADQLIASGQAAPFIVVMPRDRVWLEPTEDKFGLAVEQVLIPWIDEHYRTVPTRQGRAIGGLSRGGAWAVNIGLSHPELFGAVGIHSGFVFYTDIQPFYLWLANMPEGIMPRIYMDISDDDSPEISESAIWMEELFTKYNIPHEWHIFIGEHEEEYWHAHVEDYLRWYTKDWK